MATCSLDREGNAIKPPQSTWLPIRGNREWTRNSGTTGQAHVAGRQGGRKAKEDGIWRASRSLSGEGCPAKGIKAGESGKVTLQL